MLQPEQKLTDFQRQEAAQRILSDAELITRGATVSAVGTLVLGDTQAEYLRLQDESPYFHPDFINEDPPTPSAEEDWLNTPLNDALASCYPTLGDIPQPLRKMNEPIRDMLVLGRD